MRDKAIYNTHSNVVSIEDGVAKDVNGNIVILDDALVNTELAKIESSAASTQYQRDRLVAYSKLNQFDLLSTDAINGTTIYKDSILAIKAKYPKPL